MLPHAPLGRLLERLRHDEQGSILPYAVGGTVVLVIVGLLLITYLGDAYDDRRQASTAADAAALAAAQAWASTMEDRYAEALLAGDDAEFWDAVGQPLGDLTSDAAAAADEYAALNDATVSSVSYDALRARVTVTVEGNDQVQDTGRTYSSTATAEIVFVHGVCNSGGRLGMMVSGACRTGPAATSAPTGPDPDPSTEPTTSFALPDGMAAAASTRTRLVAP